ncbi:unnamed protein product [Rhizophagus irregularis]|nr:unnamed protein product [Rhizophagus irregularis]
MRNATEEEQEAFHSNKSYNFHIPDNNIQNDFKIETMQQQVKKLHINDDDEEEVRNNPNLHSEEQDELELLDNI